MGFNWVMVPPAGWGTCKRGRVFSARENWPSGVNEMNSSFCPTSSPVPAADPMQYLGHTYTKTRVVYLKIKFNWASCIQSGNLSLKASASWLGGRQLPDSCTSPDLVGVTSCWSFASALLTHLLQPLPDLSGSGGLICYWSPHPAFLSHLELIAKFQILCP